MRLFKTDFTYTMVAPVQELSRPKTNNSVNARSLTSDELAELAKDPKYDLSATAVKDVAEHNHFCFGTFNQGILSAYIFLATEIILPKHNTAGIGFGGIGMRLPKDVMYIYKGFSVPEYRGQRQVNIAIAKGADTLLGPKGWMVSTVEIGNLASIKMLENVGLKRQDQFREYRILGKGKYRIPKAIQLGLSGNQDSKRVELFTPS